MASPDFTREDRVRHRVGTCPACRSYLWAEVTVQTRLGVPSLDVGGKASVIVSARPVAMSVEHRCTPEGDE